MNIQLLNGVFAKGDALLLISEMIHAKIKFHEEKIKSSQNIEDQKMRETRIKQLQNALHELREQLKDSKEEVMLSSLIKIEKTEYAV